MFGLPAEELPGGALSQHGDGLADEIHIAAPQREDGRAELLRHQQVLHRAVIVRQRQAPMTGQRLIVRETALKARARHSQHASPTLRPA